MEAPMQKPNDLNQSRIVLEQDSTRIAVIEMSLSSWLVAGIVPGVERQPLKKLAVDESALLKLLHRWREQARKQVAELNQFRQAVVYVDHILKGEKPAPSTIAALGLKQKMGVGPQSKART